MIFWTDHFHGNDARWVLILRVFAFFSLLLFTLVVVILDNVYEEDYFIKLVQPLKKEKTQITNDYFLQWFNQFFLSVRITADEDVAKVFRLSTVPIDRVLGNQILISTPNASFFNTSGAKGNEFFTHFLQHPGFDPPQFFSPPSKSLFAVVPLRNQAIPFKRISSCKTSSECYLFVSEDPCPINECVNQYKMASISWTCLEKHKNSQMDTTQFSEKDVSKKCFRVDILSSVDELERTVDSQRCKETERPLTRFCGNPVKHLADFDSKRKRLFLVQPWDSSWFPKTANLFESTQHDESQMPYLSYCITYLDLDFYHDASECFPIPRPWSIDVDFSRSPVYVHYDPFIQGLLIFYFDLKKSLILTVLDVSHTSKFKPKFSVRFKDLESSWIIFSADPQAKRILLLGEKLLRDGSFYGLDLQTGQNLRIMPQNENKGN